MTEMRKCVICGIEIIYTKSNRCIKCFGEPQPVAEDEEVVSIGTSSYPTPRFSV